jgi:predicted RNA-binding protein associated with RNAse of E/G family
MTTITVRKLNEKGQETWRYQGRLVERGADYLILEAFFDREDTQVHGMMLARGDRFIETYFTDRWYNIFEIYDRADDHLRGYYCNIGFPAEIGEDKLSYVDLALDLLVFPDGRQVVVDEDEFERLKLTASQRQQARAALKELQQLFAQRFEVS